MITEDLLAAYLEGKTSSQETLLVLTVLMESPRLMWELDLASCGMEGMKQEKVLYGRPEGVI